ncbi:MAG: polysaccharide biosynthesis tyrosine autokinase [Bacteroidota bacterium]
MEAGKNITRADKNIIESFIFRYLPYWPLFTALLLIAGTGAYAYLKYMAKPAYEISANIMVEDQNKGADESKILQALNIASNKIVDNEIEILHSKKIMKDVIDSLFLYAPIYEDRKFTSFSAYTSSPIIIELKGKTKAPEENRIYFSYNRIAETLTISGKSYALNQWVNTPFGAARFHKNNHYLQQSTYPLYFSISDPKEVMDGISSRLKVSTASKLSSVIMLSLTDEVPQRGEDILNLLINNYYKTAVEDKNSLASNTLTFVNKRIQRVSKELDSIENKLRQFKNQKGIVDLSEQGKLYLQNVGDNDRKMTDMNIQLAMLNEVEKYVQENDNKIGIVPSIGGGKDQQLLNQLLQKMYESQMQYERLKKTIPEGNPSMYSLKNEIENIRPTIMDNIRNQRASLLAGKNNLNTGTEKYISMLSSIPAKEKDLLDISRQQAIKNDAYGFLLQKREETALAHAAMVNSSKTINPATASYSPVSPKKLFIFSSSLAAALLLGFAFVNMKESLTNKILFRSDIEQITSIPIVAEIMNIKGKSPQLQEHNMSINQLNFIESFHQLRFAMGLNNRVLNYKKILVTSGNESEGKSFISNNLALSLASSGKKVVLIDFDVRNPKTSGQFGMTDNAGLAEYLDNNEIAIENVVYPTHNKNLFIIPAGFSTTNPTDLLMKKDLEIIFKKLEEDFDYIIMDSAPIDPIIDAYIISEYSDAILFVIRHGHSTKAMLESLQKSNKINALKNTFIVFNDIKTRGFIKKDYGYGYGYGSNKTYGYNYKKIAYQLTNSDTKIARYHKDN